MPDAKSMPTQTATIPSTAVPSGPQRKRGRPPQTAPGTVPGAVQSLGRALDLMESVAAAEQGAGLSELAKATGLAPSTAHRLLKTLQQRRYVSHDAERGLWFVGVQSFTVGAAFLRTRNVVAAARPVMRQLMEESGESVSLAVLDGADAVYLAQIECRAMMRALARPGGRAPLHCSGVGKALLAALAEGERVPLYQRIDFTRYTEHTLTDADVLEAALRPVAARGFAIDDEEFALGLRCVAAAIRDEYGEPVAAISCSGPTARVTAERVEPLGRLVAAAAAEIALALGAVQKR
ncbi:MAG TPA: IclR family transcriptional regulator C-terminal domain-containing protein [Aliidongia sp.]|uniref:IclR family transcriptional regulator n=1 Tax=Aliidongia sp. TaxID=1914230 RepID=UPI002DDCCEBD|nr:IclR family transcriptional regulator C-terminal domain-containing protein [Aliidongia sp.]HEV2675961.1 IclR family transcriptional regulator C-terminal domain-containing protein [Aliidongia sp.]